LRATSRATDHLAVRPLRVRRPAPLLLVSALAVSRCDEETGSSPSRPVIPTGNTDDGESVNRCDTALRLPPAATLPPLRGTFAPDATLDALLRVPADLPYRPGPFAVSASLLADFNGDGRTDLLLNDQRDTAGGQPQPPAAPSRVWIALQQDNGTLGAPARVPGVHRCHLAADLDGDQRLDLVCGLDRGSSAVLWGTAGGYDVARLTELPVPDPPIAVAAWDLDLDGGLDLVLSSFGRRTTVVHARGARRFDDVTARWGVDVQGLTFQAAFLDFDGDGRHDLYFSDDGSGHENRAFRTVHGDRDPDPRFERVRPTEAACDPMGFFGTSNAAAMGVARAERGLSTRVGRGVSARDDQRRRVGVAPQPDARDQRAAEEPVAVDVGEALAHGPPRVGVAPVGARAKDPVVAARAGHAEPQRAAGRAAVALRLRHARRAPVARGFGRGHAAAEAPQHRRGPHGATAWQMRERAQHCSERYCAGPPLATR
jgi:hypothetical protein